MHDSSLRPPTVEFFMHRSSDCRIQSGETRMGATASAVRIRHDLHSRLINARKRTDDVFRIVLEDALYDRPIAERHRIIFYIGHVEAFDWTLLAERALGLQSFHPSFDQLFSFGIDPVGRGLPTDQPRDWPAREEIEQYNQRLRSELDGAIALAMRRPSEGHPQLTAILEVAVGQRWVEAGRPGAFCPHRPPGKADLRGPRHTVQTPPLPCCQRR